MATKSRPGSSRPPSLLSVALVLVGFYFARDVLIPVALAVLLSFVLAPVVMRLERAGVRRALAVMFVALLMFLGLGGLGWWVGNQAVDLAAKIPEYRENLHAKIVSLRSPHGSALSKAAETIKSLNQDFEPEPTTAPATQKSTPSKQHPAPVTPAEPTPVRVVDPPLTGIGVLRSTLSPLWGPLEIAGIVSVLVIFILLELEDLRDRLLLLLGGGRLNVATQAMEDAAERVSRYLLIQSAINAAVGLTLGLGLMLLGVPNGLLWGLIAGVLRFIPYIGIWLAALPALALTIAVFPGWSHAGIALGLFLLVELTVSNFLEPIMYGSGTGVSTVAILVAALCWSFLWGGVGLLLSTPLTVCLVVIGQYVPRLRFLSVALSDRPAMSPAARLYHRLLAMDAPAAGKIAAEFREGKPEARYFDRLLIPALIMAEHDRHRDELSPEREKFIYDAMLRLAQGETPAPAADAQPAPPERAPQESCDVLCLPAKDRADEIAGVMLCRLLAAHDISAAALSSDQLAGEAIARIESEKPRVVCVSAVPPAAASQAGYLCKRLRSRLPDVTLIVGIWKSRDSAHRQTERFQAEFDARFAATLAEAVEQIRSLAQRPAPTPA